jgi:hypothetical protein
MTSRLLSLLTCALLTFALCSSTFARKRSTQTQLTTSAAITKTIQDFWTGLGTFDSEAMKQTLGWPVTLVEASANETKNPKSIASPAEFEELIRSGHRPASGKSEFAGAKLTGHKIQMLSDTLAIATYIANLDKETTGHKVGDFNLVAILRKEPPANTWKILFMTVPK